MANGRHPEAATALMNTTSTPGQGNDGREGNENFSMITGSSRQGSINYSSNRSLLVDSIKEDDFDLLWRLRKYLVLLGVLAVSVTYNAGLTPPGGFWTLNKDGHYAGDPVLRDRFSRRYEVFFYCNATAFAASLVLIILLLSKRVTRKKMWLRSMQFTMILDLFSLLGAYAAGSCRALKSSIYIWVLVLAVFVYVGIHILVCIRVIPETLRKKVQTMLNGILSRWGVGDRNVSSHLKKEIEEARKFILMLVTFAATITYQAGLNPPGGFWAENEHDPLNKLLPALPPYRLPATSVLRSNYLHRYNIFVTFNSTSFVASLVIVILLLSPELSRHGIRTKAVIMCVVADLLCLIGAYAAGCCRDVATSFYVLFILIIVLISFALLAGIFVYKPVAHWLQKVKLNSMCCMSALGRVLSLKFGSNRSSNAEHENSHASCRQSSVRSRDAPAEGSAPEPEDQSAESHRVSDGNEAESHEEHPPERLQQTANMEEAVPNSPHPSENSQQSASIKDVVSNLEDQSTDGQLVANMEGDVSNSQHTSGNNQESVNTKDVVSNLEDRSTDGQLVANMKGDVSNSQHTSGNNQESGNTKYVVSNLEDRSTDGQLVANMKGDVSNSQHTSGNNQESVNTKDVVFNLEDRSTGGQLVANMKGEVSNSQHTSGNNQESVNTKDVVSILEDRLTDDQLVANMKGDMSNSQHTSGNNQESVNTKDVVSNLEDQSTDGQLVADTKDTKSSTEQEHPSLSHQQTVNTNYGMPTDNQQAASMKAPTDDLKTPVLPVEHNLLVGDTDGATNHDIVEEVIFVPVEGSGNVDCAEQNTSVEDENRDIENGGSKTCTKHFWNGHIDSTLGAPDQNAEKNRTDKHLKKTRTYLLLLAILAVSLTYQSGLNPPGGFWSRSEDHHHSAGDRILEDTHHPRFIAFFYLNAVAFVASIVMIIMLLNKMMSKKVTKRRALPIMMIVVLLSLTGAFAMGNCRETKKSIVILVLLCLVFAYAVIHALIAIHIIPREWKRQVSEKLKHLSCKHLRSVLCQSDHGSTEDGTNGKELERRCNLLLTLAILAATVTYQAGLNPPGGVWSDEKGVTGAPGNPVLEVTHPKRYAVFYYSNSVSFVSSVVVTILLVNKESCEHGIRSYALRVCLVVGLLGLLIAYVAGSCRNRQQSIYLSIIAAAVLVSLVIQVLLSSMHATLGRPLAQFIGYLQSHLFTTETIRREVTSEMSEASDCDEKIVRKRHKYLMLLAILAATIAYQAGLNPPGGFWSDGESHVAGNPVLHDINHQRYKIFFCFNSFAFMASIVVIMLLLSKSVRKKDVPLEVLHLIMILDLLALMTAFAAGSCRKFRTSMYVYALVVGVVIYLVLVIVLSSGIAKYLMPRKRSGLSFQRLHHRASLLQ